MTSPRGARAATSPARIPNPLPTSSTTLSGRNSRNSTNAALVRRLSATSRSCSVLFVPWMYWESGFTLYPNVAENGACPLTLTLSPRFMYQYCFSSAGRGNGRGAMSFLMSFALEPEIVTLAWTDNASVQFPLNIYAAKGLILPDLIPHLHYTEHDVAGDRRVAPRSGHFDLA